MSCPLQYHAAGLAFPHRRPSTTLRFYLQYFKKVGLVFKVQSSYKHCPSGMAYTQAKHTQNITVRNQFRISVRVNLERGVTSYFPGDRDKESTHSPFSPCTNRVGCVRCWGNFAETNRLALNGLKLWSPLTICNIISHTRVFFNTQNNHCLTHINYTACL